MNSFIAFDGNSLIDKSPILGIVTISKPKNPKVGDMAQLWIIRKDMSPVDAVTQGADAAICGACPHRHNKGGACYVMPFHAPLSVYKSYLKGNYNKLSLDDGLKLLNDRGLRLGAYGDPAALPDEVLQKLYSNALFCTGYTHQWKNKRLRHALKYCQASVDSLGEIQQLKDIAPDAKYFRVTGTYDSITSDEIICPSEKGKSCAECGLCDGNTRNVLMKIHGRRAKRFTEADIKVKVI